MANLNGVEELTTEQIKAFNALKRAYKKCKDTGIFFVNIYGDLTAYDGNLVAGYGDYTMRPDGVFEVELYGDSGTTNSFYIGGDWADDRHILGLTEKGKELYLSED